MARLTKDRSALLDKLVGDCVAYSLKPKESLEYIGREYGVIDERTYFRRRKRLLSEETTSKWYSDFARIRFVRLHSKIIDDLERSYNDTNAQIFAETLKTPRSEGLIIRLKQKLEETAEIMSEFASDTPVIDAIRQKIEGNKEQQKKKEMTT